MNFPDDWAITQSPNHWSTEETMLEYIEGIIVPYVEAVRENLPVSQINPPALAIFDVFAAHKSEKVLSALKKLTFDMCSYRRVVLTNYSR